MQITQFDKPVSILVGLGYPAKIHTAKQAYEFLSETPAIPAKIAHSVALKACRAALAGEIEVETARSTFIAFAKRSGILMPEVLPAQASHPVSPRAAVRDQASRPTGQRCQVTLKKRSRGRVTFKAIYSSTVKMSAKGLFSPNSGM